MILLVEINKTKTKLPFLKKIRKRTLFKNKERLYSSTGQPDFGMLPMTGPTYIDDDSFKETSFPYEPDAFALQLCAAITAPVTKK